MHHHYKDILDRVDGAPLWWDENAVPRFCEFGPDQTANIYADEAVLLLIECQSCGWPFKVALTEQVSNRAMWAYTRAYTRLDHHDQPALNRLVQETSLGSKIVSGRIHYGDPPNACPETCVAGATMNSVPLGVLEFWVRPKLQWERISALEREINCDWKDK